VSKNWSSFEKDQLLMESWRGYLEEEIVLEELDQMLLDEGMREQIQAFIQRVGTYLSKFWSSPEFREAELEDAGEALTATKEKVGAQLEDMWGDGLEGLAKIILLQLKMQKKVVNERNLYEAVFKMVQYVYKKGAQVAAGAKNTARVAAAGSTMGTSAGAELFLRKVLKDEIAGAEAVAEELVGDEKVAQMLLAQLMELPEIQQAIAADKCPANTPHEKVWHEMGLVRDPEGKCYSSEDNVPPREPLDAAVDAYGTPKAQALLKKFKAEQAAE